MRHLLLLVPVLAFGVALALPDRARAASDEAEREASCGSSPGQTGPIACIDGTDFDGDVCRAIDVFAAANGLPNAFFARLIWQESRFNPSAMSPAGAQGIAQFMPGTARMRGLANAYDPAPALARSAEYLKFLKLRFGNLGLAAAAYNSGEGRTRRITSTGGVFPLETRNFVQIITGVPVETWMANADHEVDYTLKPETSFQEACIEMASTRPMPGLPIEAGDRKPWGVQVAQAFSPETARSTFLRVQSQFPEILGDEEVMLIAGRNPSFGTRVRHSAMVGRDTREDAQDLCARLSAAGGSCIVRRN